MTASLSQSPHANLYFEPAFKMQAAKIMPGEYFVTDQNLVLVTLLGSCVAACVRDPVLAIGGMNHFLLPEGGSEASGMESARYGAYAMEVLINQLIKMGAHRDRLEAKVFGGANVVRGLVERNVGSRNAEFVLDFLKAEGIRVLARDLGDIHPRKVAYFPATGEVKVKRLRDAIPDAVLETEQRYRRRLNDSGTAGDVELFD